MNLDAVLSTLAREIELEPITSEQYERAIRRFAEHLGHTPTIADLSIDRVNGFLIWLSDRYSLSPTSIRNYRTSLIRLWSFAHATLELIDACPTKRIRRPKKPQSVVVAWSVSNVEQLLGAAKDIPGTLKCGVPAATFLTAWIWVGYETGLRPSDLRELRWSHVNLDVGLIAIAQHKTGKLHTAMIGSQSIEALRELQKHGLDLVFPLHKFGVWRWEQLLYRRAEQFGFSKHKRQGIGTLRKTHATQIYKKFGTAAAADSLGHYGDTTTVRNHYIDSRERTGYLPPSPRSDEKRA